MNRDKPRVGVYVCMCGSNIAGTVDVPEVVAAASKLTNVVVARYNQYTCSSPGQLGIQEDIEELEYEDPGFIERYKRGAYDVPCSTCQGRTTVPTLDRKKTPKPYVEAYDKAVQEDREYAQMCASERAHGA